MRLALRRGRTHGPLKDKGVRLTRACLRGDVEYPLVRVGNAEGGGLGSANIQTGTARPTTRARSIGAERESRFSMISPLFSLTHTHTYPDRATAAVPGRAAWRVRTACVLASRNHRSRAPTCTTAGATAPGAPGGRVAPPDFIKPHTHTHAHTWAHGATRGASSDAAWRARTACVVAITPVQSWPRERTAAAPTTISRTRALRLSETQKLRNTHTHTYPIGPQGGSPATQGTLFEPRASR